MLKLLDPYHNYQHSILNDTKHNKIHKKFNSKSFSN